MEAPELTDSDVLHLAAWRLNRADQIKKEDA